MEKPPLKRAIRTNAGDKENAIDAHARNEVGADGSGGESMGNLKQQETAGKLNGGESIA